MKVKEIEKLGRASIIDLAIDRVKKEAGSSFDSNTFNNVSVITNNKHILVIFKTEIAYAQLNSKYIKEITVDFSDNNMDSMIGYGFVGNQDSIHTKEIFPPTDDSKKAIAFIKNIMKENNRSINPGNTTILEKDGYYEISIKSPYYYLKYKVDKMTGKEYEFYEKHCRPDYNRYEQEGYIEITD